MHDSCDPTKSFLQCLHPAVTEGVGMAEQALWSVWKLQPAKATPRYTTGPKAKMLFKKVLLLHFLDIFF